MTLKVYQAAQYPRKAEVAHNRKVLIDRGFVDITEWVEEPHCPTMQLGELNEEEARLIAERDINAAMRCDFMLFYSEPGQKIIRGGRHVEFGVALAFGAEIIVIGGKENVFHHLNDIVHVPDFGTALVYLLTREAEMLELRRDGTRAALAPPALEIESIGKVN